MREGDQRWIEHAVVRGEVWVTVDGMKRRARLVAWNPRRGERRMIGWARVEFASGNRATVRQAIVERVQS